MRQAAPFLAAGVSVLVLCACASNPEPSPGAARSAAEPGTGDVSFRVVWDGLSDLDLYVSDPPGEQLFHQRRSSATGGLLDLDCNGDRICDAPIENVYWPTGEAPPGDYRVWVRAHRLHEGESPLAARLFILRGGKVAWERTATFARRGEILGPFTYSYGPDLRSAPPVIEEQVGWTGTWACTTEGVFAGGLLHTLTLNRGSEAAGGGFLSVVEPERKSLPLTGVRGDESSLAFVLAGQGPGGVQWDVAFAGKVDGNVLSGEYTPPEGPVVPTTCVGVGAPR